MKNIVLCGPPGVGKSTIGKRIAQQIQATFIDLDEVIESEYKKHHHHELTCRQIYQTKGPLFFRDLEQRVLEKIVKQPISRTILALGGGALERHGVISVIKEFGLIIYLSEQADVLYSRVTTSGLPAYLDQDNPTKSFNDLLTRRRQYFEDVADHTVDAQGRSIEEISEQLIHVAGI